MGEHNKHLLTKNTTNAAMRCLQICLKALLTLGFFGLVLTGCANRSVQEIPSTEVGHAYKVKFGTVLEAHPVSVRSTRTEGVTAASAGALVFGGGAALAAPSSAEAIIPAASAGGLLGVLAQWNLETNNAIEYTIALTDGSTQVIDQLQYKDDPVYDKGSAVLVKFGAERDLVMSAANLPSTVKLPKSVKVDKVDAKDELNIERCVTEKTSTDKSNSVESKHCTKE